MPTPTKLRYAHIDWQLLRNLVNEGWTLRQLSKEFKINYGSLATRSHREKWKVAAVRANLSARPQPPKDPLEVEAFKLKRGILAPLLKLSEHYQHLNTNELLKHQSSFLSFVQTALKVLSSNDGRSANRDRAVVNLVLAQTSPAELVHAAARDVGTRDATAVVLDSQSREAAPQVVENQGTPPIGEAESAKSASESSS